MAADSVIKAVEDFISGLNASLFPGGTIPSVWLDEAPQQNTPNSQAQPPYIIISDDGDKPQWDFETSAIIKGSFTLEAYALNLDDADSIMKAILWNGAPSSSRRGLAFATLTLNAQLYSMAVTPTRGQRKYSGMNYQGKRVHFTSQSFDTQVGLRNNVP